MKFILISFTVSRWEKCHALNLLLPPEPPQADEGRVWRRPLGLQYMAYLEGEGVDVEVEVEVEHEAEDEVEENSDSDQAGEDVVMSGRVEGEDTRSDEVDEVMVDASVETERERSMATFDSSNAEEMDDEASGTCSDIFAPLTSILIQTFSECTLKNEERKY
jgi:hypothetical protein